MPGAVPRKADPPAAHSRRKHDCPIVAPSPRVHKVVHRDTLDELNRAPIYCGTVTGLWRTAVRSDSQEVKAVDRTARIRECKETPHPAKLTASSELLYPLSTRGS